MLTRIAGVADIDHVYRRPDDPAHVGLLQQGGVCITHDPNFGEKSAHYFISIFVCITIAISWTACLKRAVVSNRPGARKCIAVRAHKVLIFRYIIPCPFMLSPCSYMCIDLRRLSHFEASLPD